jgi:hypothetical protein
MLLAVHSRRIIVSRGKQHAAPAAASLKSGSLLRRPTLGAHDCQSTRRQPDRNGLIFDFIEPSGA